MQVFVLDDRHLHLLPSHHGAGEGQLQERAELAKGFLLLELPHVDQLPDFLLWERGVVLNECCRSQIHIAPGRNAVHKPASVWCLKCIATSCDQRTPFISVCEFCDIHGPLGRLRKLEALPSSANCIFACWGNTELLPFFKALG